MKHRATKERRRERQEFCYKHRQEIEELGRRPFDRNDPDIHDLVTKARAELGYNNATANIDIYLSLNSEYFKKIK